MGNEFEYAFGTGDLFEEFKRRIEIREVSSVKIVGPEGREAIWWIHAGSLGKLECNNTPGTASSGAVISLRQLGSVKIQLDTRYKEQGSTTVQWTRTLVLDFPGGPETLSANYRPEVEELIDRILTALSA
ncbi:hypothetical protein [Mycolicibacterium fortuitum]|uniref:hypothetical protein n=1 Tax=Mycolicibacterium fortuitum TaxID=1766 RepID=UPI00148FC52E|nr:hypothetical protein [Mycolicibacterium fortuitum]